MKLSMNKAEVVRISQQGDYDVIPVATELLSDFITPIELLRKLKNASRHCYLLESAQANEKWGRYTFLGYDPIMDITCVDGKMKAGDLTLETKDPSSVIRQVLSNYKSPRFDHLPPFTGPGTVARRRVRLKPNACAAPRGTARARHVSRIQSVRARETDPHFFSRDVAFPFCTAYT